MKTFVTVPVVSTFLIYFFSSITYRLPALSNVIGPGDIRPVAYVLTVLLVKSILPILPFGLRGEKIPNIPV